MSGKKNKNIKWQTARAIKKNKPQNRNYGSHENSFKNAIENASKQNIVKKEYQELFANKKVQQTSEDLQSTSANHPENNASNFNQLQLLKERKLNTMEQFYQKVAQSQGVEYNLNQIVLQNFNNGGVAQNQIQNQSSIETQSHLNPQNFNSHQTKSAKAFYPNQIVQKHVPSPFTYITTFLGIALFLASLAFWFWIVQPSILDKITLQYTDKNGYVENAKIQALKQNDGIKNVVAAGKTDVENIKNMGCQNNNVQLNIKRFEKDTYKVLPQNEVVVSGFKESQVDKMYLDYVVKLNLILEEELLNQDLAMTAGNIQSLNNLSVNCARIVEKYQGLENPDFKGSVCADLKGGVLRFGAADSFTLNKICNTDMSKAKFLEELDRFIAVSADSIMEENENKIDEKINNLGRETEEKINNYYNEKLEFPNNIYLLKVK